MRDRILVFLLSILLIAAVNCDSVLLKRIKRDFMNGNGCPKGEILIKIQSFKTCIPCEDYYESTGRKCPKT